MADFITGIRSHTIIISNEISPITAAIYEALIGIPATILYQGVPVNLENYIENI